MNDFISTGCRLAHLQQSWGPAGPIWYGRRNTPQFSHTQIFFHCVHTETAAGWFLQGRKTCWHEVLRHLWTWWKDTVMLTSRKQWICAELCTCIDFHGLIYYYTNAELSRKAANIPRRTVACCQIHFQLSATWETEFSHSSAMPLPTGTVGEGLPGKLNDGVGWCLRGEVCRAGLQQNVASFKWSNHEEVIGLKLQTSPVGHLQLSIPE